MTAPVVPLGAESAPAATRKGPRLGRARYFVRRLAFYLVAAWIAITLNFLLPRLMPGDPASVLIAQMQGRTALSGDMIASIYRLFGNPSEPLWDQYLTYLGQVFRLDFGLSVAFYPTPVWEVISAALPWTIGLVGVVAVVSFLFGTAGGILAGGRAGSKLDSVATPGAMFMTALPTFWIALLFVLVLGFQLAWLPTGGAYDPDLEPGLSGAFLGSVVTHAILPALTIAMGWAATWYIGMRNMMITTVSEDYVLLARAKGLSKGTVLFRYAARNAMLPSVAGFAVNLGNVVGGQLLVEAVYAYPGVGYLLFQSVASVDYPLMQALFLMVSLSVLAANFLADSVYGLIDPRARETGS
ncbi:peptide ABC transporter permease [Streptomyces spiroverticillatus]|uniref:Peptide ABC transporter permease n=1 Tax=Streptomyces finlayi TaxID=67296 RepID=A0A919CAL0_9ACTN|nr:ABC transporter permease [Streptomyces finlayi]GHA15300.1 peptide ABC transporter permease [Streptomyces spiroverticillatus]GHC96773.1 peptide ABC transporter permease [Streptomyces finlayi]